MRHVVLPQAFRRTPPPLGNNAIALPRLTSLVSAIGPLNSPTRHVPWPVPMAATGNRNDHFVRLLAAHCRSPAALVSRLEIRWWTR